MKQVFTLLGAITAALEESSDQEETVIFPPLDPSSGIISRAHAELAGKYGCGSVLTVPFLDNQGTAYGGILLERAGNEPFDKETVTLGEAVATLAGEIQRAVIAPFPGYILTARHSAGDRVDKDQILATLDTSDLTLNENGDTSPILYCSVSNLKL